MFAWRSSLSKSPRSVGQPFRHRCQGLGPVHRPASDGNLRCTSLPRRPGPPACRHLRRRSRASCTLSGRRRCRPAKSTATELAESACRLIPVCSRTSLPVRIAVWKAWRRGRLAIPAFSAVSSACFIWPRTSNSPTIIDSSPLATRKRCLAASMPRKLLMYLQQLAIGSVQHRFQELRRRSFGGIRITAG